MAPSQHRRDQQPPAVPTTRNNVALGMIAGAFVGVVALTAPFVVMQLRSSLPYMATPRGKVERALAFVSRRMAASGEDARLRRRPGDSGARPTFVDLGSGDGTAVLAAASMGWNATGMELNPTLWFISSIRRWFSPIEVRRNSRMVFGDMFQSEVARTKLRGADCVMIFGVQPLMPKIADMVQRECPPGCHLMSYRFRVPLMKDSNADAKVSSGEHGIDATSVYDEEEMRIYSLGETLKE